MKIPQSLLFTILLSRVAAQSAVMMCPPISAPVNAYLKGNCMSATTGDTCVLFCNSGFKLDARGKKLMKDGSLELKCGSDGLWDQHRSQEALVASCVGPSECKKDVSKVKDGFSKGACSPGYSGQVCEYNCRPGYKLKGPSGLVCLPTGKWNKDPPTCIIDEHSVGIKCSNLIYNKNGGVFLGSCSPGRYQQKCQLKCAEGYQIVSTDTSPAKVITNNEIAVFTCMSNGYWDKPAHTLECQRVNN